MVTTPRDCRIEWGSPPDKKVSGCKDGVYKEINPQDIETIVPPSSTCVWKATFASSYPPDAKAPGGGWDQFEVGFCAFVGCAALASDYYYVLPHKKAISGTLYSSTVDAAGNRVGIANSVVKLSGASSGTAVTNRDGFYDALVDPGRYTVHVESVNGQSVDATPIACSPGTASGSDCKLDVGGHDGVADFSSCGSPGPAADVARIAAAPSAAGCPLRVAIKRLDGDKSGLSDVLDSPEFMNDSGKCESGCSDLKITVTDPANGNRPVPNAKITASVSAIPDGDLPKPNHGNLPGFPSGADPGSGYLCAETSSFATTSPGCGTGRLIKGLTTDSQGNADLRYWAPGIVTADSPKVKVIARETCTATQCSAKQKVGHQSIVVKISPNVIYKADGKLTLKEADELAEWTSRFGIGVKFFASQGFEKGAEALVEHLVEDEEQAEKISSTVSGVLSVAEFAHAVWEQQLALAEFLEPLGLSGTGLGRPPDDPTVSAVPGSPFLSAVDADGTPPFHVGHKGLMWSLGETLLFRKEAKDGTFGAQFTHVDVYEVSFCERNGKCGPGYHGETGIKPFLYFDFSSKRNDFAHVYQAEFVVPYNAAAWFLTQKNLRQLP